VTVWKRRTWLAAFLVLAILAAGVVYLWNDRPDLSGIDWQRPVIAGDSATDTVTVTWFGVTTLLFDDGETQILIDGFFSRPTLVDILLERPVNNDAAVINYVLDEYRLRRLAAIIPVHSHFDHAMDIGAIANRTSASILGSASTVAIARGAGVPEDQITEAVEQQVYEFGKFAVTLLHSTHAPVGWSGSVPMAGSIDEPLVMPQPISAWREGGSYTIVIRHPQGTAIVQGSAGFSDTGALSGELAADAVFLSVGGLETLGREYAEQYWQSMVTTTGASTVYILHFDDFTRPLGEVVPAPRVAGDIEVNVDWFAAFRDRWDKDVTLILPEFGVPMALYARPSPDT
jgi:L-ascorbate metabolism protein UlaG (beta-lactamase superfamily)